jgi:hypothetical protein
VLGYARRGTSAQAAAAWTAILDGARSPLASAASAAAADALSAAVLDELYLHTTGAITAQPTDAEVVAAIAAADGKALLINSDGVRSFATRRLVVDALKAAQNTSGVPGAARCARRDHRSAQRPVAVGPRADRGPAGAGQRSAEPVLPVVAPAGCGLSARRRMGRLRAAR